MPAPTACRPSAASNSTTWNPCCASARLAVSPPIPAPAITTAGEAATAHRSGAEVRLAGRPRELAFRRPRRMGIEAFVVAKQGRAIRADDFRVVAHIEENVGMIERRSLADAHEFSGADLDDRHAGSVVEMGHDLLCHGRSVSTSFPSARHHNGPHV